MANEREGDATRLSGLSYREFPRPELPKLPPRETDSHKGSFGHALLIGGSRGMAGALSLATRAALRMGAGLATQALPESSLTIATILNPSAMTLALPEDSDGRIAGQALALVESWYRKADAMALGPGLGRSADLQQLVLSIATQAPCPVVLDADALNSLAESGEAWKTRCPAPRILTPHPGEWSRLSGVPAHDTEQQRAAAVAMAASTGLVIVLKGHHTLITDGHSAVLNTTGTPAMATGGSGDALTGMIVALLCQGLSAFQAAQLGVCLHGLAGQLAADELGSHVVLPQELIDRIPVALRLVNAPRAKP